MTTPTFGGWLRMMREARGVSLRALARGAEISATYLSHIEMGTANPPSLDVLRRIAAAMGIDSIEVIRAAGREADLAAEIVSRDPALIAELVRSHVVGATGGTTDE